MEKYDLSDTTFLIPFRPDSLCRLENLLSTIDFLQRNFITNIKVLESGEYNNHILDRLLSNVDYLFIEDCDLIYFRTKFQNQLAQHVVTDHIAIWEADIVAYPALIYESVQKLRLNLADVALPYDGKVLDTSFILRNCYIELNDFNFLNRHRTKMNLMYNSSDLVGGAVFINREKYLQAGGDNEMFYGWGNEDFERYTRWDILGYRIFRAEGYLFHLSHPRGVNSQYISGYHSTCSRNMLKQIGMSSPEEIRNVLNI